MPIQRTFRSPDDPCDLDHRTFWDFRLKGTAVVKSPGNATRNSVRGHLPSDVQVHSSCTIIRDILPSDIGTFLKDVTSFNNVEFGLTSEDTLSMSSGTCTNIIASDPVN